MSILTYPGHLNWEHIRTWEEDGFRLEMWDTFRTVRGGPQERLAYQLFDGERLIFQGDDYGCSPLHSIDGDESVAGLLSFLSLREGDTDPGYFDNYTPDQIDWRDGGRAEYLGSLACQLEES
jgi:hypothetical protein